ncbi:MAG: FAD-dependent monooxygenase [Luminiphilus sp.]
MQIAVVGGGMVGLAFALAIKNGSPSADIRVLEARTPKTGAPPPLDSRATALNLASRSLLDQWGIWQQVAQSAADILAIHVSSKGRFGSALMEAVDVGETALGYVIENHLLGRLLLQHAEDSGVVFQAPVGVQGVVTDGAAPVLQLQDGGELAADLVIVADGADSLLARQLGISSDRRDVAQRAIAANVRCRGGQQQGVAWERFTAHGPIALLPLPEDTPGYNRYNLIWSAHPEQAAELEGLDDAEFLSALQREVGWRAGQLTAVGQRSAWDLTRVCAREQVRSGVVIAGNAAHTLHPVAGQGFNLSLRDAAALALALEELPVTAGARGSMAALQRYQQLTAEDQRFTTGATDLLATLFRSRGPLLDLPRDAALATLDLLPPLRRRIAQRGTGQGITAATGQAGS